MPGVFLCDFVHTAFNFQKPVVDVISFGKTVCQCIFSSLCLFLVSICLGIESWRALEDMPKTRDVFVMSSRGPWDVFTGRMLAGCKMLSRYFVFHSNSCVLFLYIYIYIYMYIYMYILIQISKFDWFLTYAFVNS